MRRRLPLGIEARLPVEATQAVDRLSSLAWRRGHKEGRGGAGDDGGVNLRDAPVRLGRRGAIGSTRIAHRGGRRFNHGGGRDGGAVRRRGRCTGRCTGCLGGGFIWELIIWELFIWELGVHLRASLSVADLGLGGRFARELARDLVDELEVSLEQGREVIKRKVQEFLVCEVLVLLMGSATKAIVRERELLPKGVVVRERALAEAHLLVNAR